MAIRVGVQVGTGGAQLRVPGGRRHVCRSVRAAVLATLADRGITAAEVSVTLLDDPGIAALNREHLGHPGPTDVISFALFEEGEPVVGDVYVGLEQALRQARALGMPFDEEVVRLAIHGTLHVLGMDHPSGPGRGNSPMWRLQERLVKRWKAAT